MSGLCPDER